MEGVYVLLRRKTIVGRRNFEENTTGMTEPINFQHAHPPSNAMELAGIYLYIYIYIYPTRRTVAIEIGFPPCRVSFCFDIQRPSRPHKSAEASRECSCIVSTSHDPILSINTPLPSRSSRLTSRYGRIVLYL